MKIDSKEFSDKPEDRTTWSRVHHAQRSTPGCTDALTAVGDVDIKIAASDFDDSDSEHDELEPEESESEEFKPGECDLEESGPEESDLEASEPEESEIFALIRAEQERFENRRRVEQEMTYRAF